MRSPSKLIMTVSKHVAVRRGIRDLLADSRYRVVAEASNGHSAFRLAKAENPDIVILDSALCKMSGLEIAQHLKGLRPSLEVLMFSMRLSDQAIIESIRGGIRGFVSKSDPASELIAALDAVSLRRLYYSESVNAGIVERVVAGRKLRGGAFLSSRESTIVQMVAEGWLMREIAGRLGVSKKTVEAHRKNALDKINCKSTADLVHYAVRNDLVQA